MSTQKLQSSFVDFLTGVLEEISHTYRFDFSHLDSNEIISASNQTESSGIKCRVRMDGHIYYFDEVPSKESLTQSLNVYFSFWGATDLQDYLVNVGFDGVVIVSISIGGQAVSFVPNFPEEEGNEVESQNNASQSIFIEDGGDLSKSTVVVLYTGFVIAAAAISLITFRHYIGRKRRKRDAQMQSRETRLSKKPNGGTSEGNGDPSNRTKKNSRKMWSMGQSSASKEQVLPEPTKAFKDSEIGEDISQPFTNEAPAERKRKSDDSKVKQETYCSKDNVPDNSSAFVADDLSPNSKPITDQPISSTIASSASF